LDLIGIFFENPWLFFLLLIFLSGMFSSPSKQKQENRKAPGGKEHQQAPTRRTFSEGAKTIFDEIRHELEKEAFPTGRETVAREEIREGKPVLRVPERVSEQNATQKMAKIHQNETFEQKKSSLEPLQRRDLAREINQLELAIEKKKEVTTAIAKGSFIPNKSKVVEGIIWSEILGQPRAKKPYQPGSHR